jgi:hypothetical protein
LKCTWQCRTFDLGRILEFVRYDDDNRKVRTFILVHAIAAHAAATAAATGLGADGVTTSVDVVDDIVVVPLSVLGWSFMVLDVLDWRLSMTDVGIMFVMMCFLSGSLVILLLLLLFLLLHRLLLLLSLLLL